MGVVLVSPQERCDTLKVAINKTERNYL